MPSRADLAGFIATALLIAAMLLPVISIIVLGITSTGSVWGHLASTVLPRAITDTLIVLIGTGIITIVAGAFTAWLVTMYRFPGRDIIDRLLIVPLAMPTYIVAYCYVELLDAAGPVQTLLRTVVGWETARDYWFPEIRSPGGAILVMSSVLYPYVYLSARASFVQQSICALEVARTLGRTENGALWSVALPLARPALIAGVALVMMECLNDIGAVEYLGVETLTATIYTTWVQRQSLGSAAQISTVMLLFVFALFTAERFSRGQAQFHHTTSRYRPITFATLHGWQAVAATAACLTPFIIGFAIPFAVIINGAIIAGIEAMDARFWSAIGYSLTLATIAAVVVVIVGLFLAHTKRNSRAPLTAHMTQLSGLGYAVPGTVLAIGLLIPLAGLDIWISSTTQSLFGVSLRQLFAGTLFTLIFAYTIRFTAISLGTIDAGFQRISPNIDAAARTLGETKFTTLIRVHLPILLPALGAAALMVFVDTMKELPATLLLRPFNVETLATLVYSKADAFEFEQASVAALAIVVAGLLPVLLLHRAIAHGRPGHKTQDGRPGRRSPNSRPDQPLNKSSATD